MSGLELQLQTTELARIRTELAIERTFLALLRTAAIFIGISSLLYEKTNMKLLSLCISLFCLITNIIATVYYIKNMDASDNLFEKKIPVLYSFLILIVLLSLIIYNTSNYIKIIKKRK
jgi:uncharacterized membrane protein YidH (DUF202 family)